jgi:hypothetical protein
VPRVGRTRRSGFATWRPASPLRASIRIDPEDRRDPAPQLCSRPSVDDLMTRLTWASIAVITCVVGLLATGSGSNAASSRPDGSMGASDLVPTHWRKVADGLTEDPEEAVLAASNRYLALETAQHTVALLNTTNNQRTPLAPPNCRTPGGAAFGGPWLALQCSTVTASAPIPFIDLLNLETGQWTTSLLDPGMCDQYGVGCMLDSVGNIWIRFQTTPSGEHESAPTFLQNIATGALQTNPGAAGASDNLNKASGVSHPCVKLPTPALDEDFLGTPDRNGAYFVQLGRFILATTPNDGDNPPNILLACGSSTRTLIPQGFVASNDLVFWPQNYYAPDVGARIGVSLPSLRKLVVRSNKGVLVAASNRTLYETTVNQATRSFDLWATTVPKSSMGSSRQ